MLQSKNENDAFGAAYIGMVFAWMAAGFVSVAITHNNQQEMAVKARELVRACVNRAWEIEEQRLQ